MYALEPDGLVGFRFACEGIVGILIEVSAVIVCGGARAEPMDICIYPEKLAGKL